MTEELERLEIAVPSEKMERIRAGASWQEVMGVPFEHDREMWIVIDLVDKANGDTQLVAVRPRRLAE